MNTRRTQTYLAVASAIMVLGFRHGEGDDDKPITKEALAAAVAEAAARARQEATAEFQGVAQKNTELLEEVKGLKKIAKQIEGVDLPSLLDFKSKIENDAVLKLMSEGKHEEAIGKATEKLTSTYQAQLTEKDTALAELQALRQSDIQLIEELLIDGGAKDAFINAKGEPKAIDDAVLRARQIWKVEKNAATGKSELVARDGEGKLIQGAKGPLTMAEWSEGLKKTAPHLFPKSVSGDLGGEGGEGGSGGDLEAQIVAASANGDFKKLRELRKQRDGR